MTSQTSPAVAFAGDPSMLTFAEWKSLTAEVSYKMYIDLFMRVKRNDNFSSDAIGGFNGGHFETRAVTKNVYGRPKEDIFSESNSASRETVWSKEPVMTRSLLNHSNPLVQLTRCNPETGLSNTFIKTDSVIDLTDSDTETSENFDVSGERAEETENRETDFFGCNSVLVAATNANLKAEKLDKSFSGTIDEIENAQNSITAESNSIAAINSSVIDNVNDCSENGETQNQSISSSITDFSPNILVKKIGTGSDKNCSSSISNGVRADQSSEAAEIPIEISNANYSLAKTRSVTRKTKCCAKPKQTMSIFEQMRLKNIGENQRFLEDINLTAESSVLAPKPQKIPRVLKPREPEPRRESGRLKKEHLPSLFNNGRRSVFSSGNLSTINLSYNFDEFRTRTENITSEPRKINDTSSCQVEQIVEKLAELKNTTFQFGADSLHKLGSKSLNDLDFHPGSNKILIALATKTGELSFLDGDEFSKSSVCSVFLKIAICPTFTFTFSLNWCMLILQCCSCISDGFLVMLGFYKSVFCSFFRKIFRCSGILL